MDLVRRGLLVAGAIVAPTLAVNAVAAPAAVAGSLASRLLGAWKIEDAVTVQADGRVGRWRDRPRPCSGLIIYAPSGHVSAQIASQRGTAARSAEFDTMPAAERLAFLGSYYSYFGRFEIDEANSVVSHHVESSLDPSEVGAVLRRKVLLEGDRLTLNTLPTPGRPKTSFNRLTWVRG